MTYEIDFRYKIIVIFCLYKSNRTIINLFDFTKKFIFTIVFFISIQIMTTKNGDWWPSSTVQYQAGSGSQTFILIENCNGQPYTITLRNNTGVTFAAVVREI